MATLKPRRGKWYARVLWYDNIGRKQEKQVPLRTDSKVIARERLYEVNKVELDIKNGLSFSFPWLNDEGAIKVVRFTLGDAISEWMKRRRKNGIRPKTLEINDTALKHFTNCTGKTRPLKSVTTDDIDEFCDYMIDLGLSITSINMYLRTIKSLFRYNWKRERLDRIPIIEQQPIEKREPIYITDFEFQSIMNLDWLDKFYKRVFYFYRETGCRLYEPFMSILNGKWLDIPNLSKGKRKRSIELNKSLIEIYNELMVWHETCGLVETSKGRHISKKFKKCLRYIGVSEEKHFHSLRHTFAVRRIIENVSIYKVQKLMGHSSVTTTEIYANMDLKRVKDDFPTLTYVIPKLGMVDTQLVDTRQNNLMFINNKTPN